RRPELHLYREATGYRTATLYRDAKQFQQNLACALLDGTAHVALQPPVSKEFLAEVGLPLATSRLIAHESAHLARMAAVVDARRHPRWLADAMAQAVAHEVLSQRGLARAMESEPEFATQFVRAERLRRERRLPDVRAILGRRTESDASFGLSHDLYATHLAFGSWLREDAATPFATIVRDLFDGRDEFTVPNDTASFLRFVETRRPQWDEVRRSLGWRRVEESWLLEQVAFEAVDAVAWSTRPIDSRAFACALRFRFLPAKAARADVLLAGVDGRVHRVSCGDDGEVGLWRYEPREDRWQRVVGVAAAGAPVVGDRELELVIEDGVLAVDPRSDRALRHEVGALARLGFGCASGSAVRWVRVPFGY
ncbi:MAG: hypothetical protein AB7I19_10285, partial [Planctomycetota bacterium]